MNICHVCNLYGKNATANYLPQFAKHRGHVMLDRALTSHPRDSVKSQIQASLILHERAVQNRDIGGSLPNHVGLKPAILKK